MNHVLETILTSQVVSDGKATFPLHSHVSPEVGRFLQEIIARVEPTCTLEVGMAYGISTLFICDALAKLNKPVMHFVIDPFQTSQWSGIGIRNVHTAGYEKFIEFYQEPSEFVLARLAAQGKHIELAFIDGWHTFDQVLVEFYFINRLLPVGGVVVFDDVDCPGVRQALRHILTYPAYTNVEFENDAHLRSTIPWKIRRRLSQIPAVARMIRSDILHPAWELGIMGRCVAVRKVAADQRSWDWHKDF